MYLNNDTGQQHSAKRNSTSMVTMNSVMRSSSKRQIMYLAIEACVYPKLRFAK